MSKLSNKLTDKLMWCFTIVMMILVYVSLDQWFDMALSSWHAYDMLECLFSGKITHFYQYTYDIANNNGYFMSGLQENAAFYSPVVYALLAIIISPLYLLDKLAGLGPDVYALANWCRMVMVALSFVAAMLVGRIYSKVSDNSDNKYSVNLFFMSSPIFLLSVILCNQFDIVGVIICLLALGFYMDGKLMKFTLLIAASMFFKLFGIVMFCPLLVLKEKRPLRIIMHSAIVVVPYALMTVITNLIDPGYKLSQDAINETYGFMDRVFKNSIALGSVRIPVVIIIYFFICLFAFLHKKGNGDDRKYLLYWASRISLISYMVFFLLIDSHEQWYIYLVPFITLVYFTSNKRTLMLVADIVFSGFMAVAYATRRNTYQYLRDTILVRKGSGNKLTEYYSLNYYKMFSFNTMFVLMVLAAALLVAIVIYETIKNRNRIDDVISEKSADRKYLWVIRTLTILLYVVPALGMYFSLPAN